MIDSIEIHQARILIVDDKAANILLLESTLLRAGYVSVAHVTDSSQVCALHREHRYDLILLDLVMPGLDGFQVMEGLKEIEEGGYIPVLVITAVPEHKLHALNAGAKDFLSKPLDLAEVLTRVHNMLEVRLLHLETKRLYDRLLAEQAAQKQLESALQEALVRVARDFDDPLGIVAKSPAMARLVDLARRVAGVDTTILITGESGSGKERVARLIHDESARAKGPFIAINCGAIAETLLESELFGHARGAFTGATHDRPGLFEAADQGTLLLDEVGEVSPGMQVKLLRVIQEREIRRVGENRNRKVDVRIVAATNRDLGVLVADGAFRQDLYYRLKVVELPVPSLRERRDDILPLARVLLAGVALRVDRKVADFAPGVADQLQRYDWPGNVRELENAMERAVAFASKGRVELEDLPEEIRRASRSPAATGAMAQTLSQVEKDFILSTLALNGGNKSRTARQLDISLVTLYRKLKSFGIPGAERKGA